MGEQIMIKRFKNIAPYSEKCSHCITFEIKCIFLSMITGFTLI